ncbi:PAS domain-containing protein [Sneathiella sp. P13V-1]|uniref:sensor histidine kinase n=1 Tax=Sneathiella sp. P13V-1 TaxID=2697366 RepID=UPI00187B9618|nr:PAS domain-containing protein [Sneathiella sp. P13V-1]MBE7638418.1 PAS domain-containing protein [Sneathiella sp. P13V-1]
MQLTCDSLQLLADNLKDDFPFMVISPDGQIEEYNSLLSGVYSDKENRKTAEKIASLYCENKHHVQRTKAIAVNGENHYIDWRLTPISQEDGPKIVCLGTDVSEIENLSKQIARTSAFAKVGYWRFDIHNREIYWSDEMYHIRNVDKSDFVPTLDKVLSGYGDDQKAELQDRFQKCLDNGESFITRMTVDKEGQETVYLETQGIPEYDSDGNIVAISGTLRDRTQEAVAEEKYLIAQESLTNLNHVSEHLRQTLNTHALVSIADVGGRIIFANRKFCEISGYSYEELLGSNHRLLKSETQDDAFFKEMWKTISSGEVWQGEICNRNKQGELYWVYSTIVPFLNKKTGKPEQYVSVRTEITHQKKMQSKLDKLFEEAMAGSEAKSKFISNMSHEFRTPLNHIMGFSELIMNFSKEEGIKENAKHILAAGNELLEKVNNVLQLVDQGEPNQGHREVFDLGYMLRTRFVANFQSNMLAENRQFEIDLPEGEFVIQADPLDVLTITRKLTDNALKFTNSEDKIAVSLGNNQSGDVVIKIEDTGPGLPEEIKNSSLSPFTIGETVITKSKSGMGVGLPLSKKLTEKNGGQFSVELGEGRGTTITLTFPNADRRHHVDPQFSTAS